MNITKENSMLTSEMDGDACFMPMDPLMKDNGLTTNDTELEC